jgi:hypothetical protein
VDIVRDLVRAYPGSSQQQLRKLARQQGLAERPLLQALEDAVLRRAIICKAGRHNTFRYYLPEPAG